MLGNLIEQVVDIQIRNITTNTYSRDLNTIMIIADHSEFTAPELYRAYTNSAAVLADGFETTSYVYNAVNTIFSQEITPTRVLVSKGVVDADYFSVLENMMVIPAGWLWLISDLRDVAKQVEIAKFVESNQKFYLAATHSVDAFDITKTTDLGSQLKELSLKNTATWYDTPILVGDDPVVETANYSEAALLGRCANGIAGSVNFRLKLLIGVTAPSTIDTQTKLDNLKAKNYNFVAYIEEQYRSFGSGKVAGGEWIHIRLGITWLEVNIREEVFYTIATPDKLDFENTGAAAIESAIRSVIARAQRNGIVAKDSPVNVSVPNVLDLTPQQRADGILPDVTFNVRMSGAIQGTVIRGEVYL